MVQRLTSVLRLCNLAANVAQFPLPVVSGIGHERDVTVLDVVHIPGKNADGVAEIFIAHLTRRHGVRCCERSFHEPKGCLWRSGRICSLCRIGWCITRRFTCKGDCRHSAARHGGTSLFPTGVAKEFTNLQQAIITSRHLSRRLLDGEGHRLMAKRTLLHSSRENYVMSVTSWKTWSSLYVWCRRRMS